MESPLLFEGGEGRGAWVLFIHFLLLLYILQLFVFFFKISLTLERSQTDVKIVNSKQKGDGGAFFCHFLFF